MITTLDTTSWSRELVTGNAEFVESPSSPTGRFFVVSNVRDLANVGGGFGIGFGQNFGNNFGPSSGGFVVLESTVVPPAPGPGSSFITRATYNFPQPNIDFDPVVAIDNSALPNPVLHIIGTRNTPTSGTTSSTQLTDLIKFTYDTVTHVLTGPVVLSTGARIRGSYDIAVLSSGDTVVAVALAEPVIANATITSVAFGGVTAPITATSVAANILTVTTVNTFQPGQSILLSGLTTSTFLNGQNVIVLTANGTSFTATFGHASYATTADTGVADPAGVLVLGTAQPASQFVPGQWLLLNGLTNATFLNGQIIQVLTVDGVITAFFLHPGVYPPTPDTGTIVPVGDSLLTMQLDTNSVLISGSAKIIASSPSRTGDAYDAVSLVTANNSAAGFGIGFGFNFGNSSGSDVELYYESHPKNITFADQQFTINLVNRQAAAAVITSSLISGGILTITANNNFVPGTIVTFETTQEAFLNGASVVVLTANSTSFTAEFIVPLSPINVELASAVNFSLLASTTISNVGATVLTGGNLGLYPGTVVTGIVAPPSANFTPPATEHINDALAQQAHIDATTAWGFYLALPAGTAESVLDGLTLTPGTYTAPPGFGFNFGFGFGQSAQMTLHTGQTLTLNGAGTYIFQIGSSPGFGVNFGSMFGGSALTIEPGAIINLTGGATADDIIWVVNGNATIGHNATMVGTVLALNDITLGGGTLTGRALSLLGFISITSAEAINTESTFVQPPYTNLTDTGTAVPAVSTWDQTPTVLTSFSARYADNRLTVIPDTGGNRYLSQTYWSQQNHPQGIIGNVILGYRPFGGAWSFHPTLGTVLGGSIIQSTLSVDLNLDVNLSYLLQPFDQIPAPPTAVAWPFHVASVAIPTLGLTEVPGFYNALNFTWLRGTKSLVDNNSLWAVVGEREVTAQVSEAWTIPATSTPSILPLHAANFEDNVVVVYTPSNSPLMQVFTDNPTKGQYYVEESSGLYVFNVLDGSATISITYNYVSGIIPVYASLFNVPPIAELSPTSIVLWRDTTFYSTDFTEITSFSITSNVVTVIAANDFVTGDQVAIYGFQELANEFLNGNTLTVLTATPTQFTANFTHADFTFIPGFGFGTQFGFGFGGVDFGFAAVLIAGPLTLDASASFSPNSDPLTYVWTDNFGNQALVTITPSPSGSTAVITVSPTIGGAPEQFNVSVVVNDLVAVPPHVSLVPTSFSISGNVVTFTVPSNLVSGEKVMPYDIVLSPPAAAPIVTSTPEGFGFDFGNYFNGSTYYFTITYVNSFGETLQSAETSAITTGAPSIMSPPPEGDAVGYNVYVGTAPGNEQLQFNSAGVLLPTPIGTNWTLAPGGVLQGTNPPTVSTAYEMFLNNIELTLQSSSPTQFTAIPLLGVTLPDRPTTAITGFIAFGADVFHRQFQIANIIVPQNVAPTITLPTPFWEPINLPTEPFVSIDVARNTKVTITPNYPIGPVWSNVISYGIGANVTFTIGLNTFTYTSLQDLNVGNSPATSPSFWAIVTFPVVYTGMTDPDDTPTWKWAQTSGTTVTIVGSTSSPSLVFDTNGVNMNGETLVFTLTVNDGINPAVTTTFAVNVDAFIFNPNAKDTLQLSRSVYSSSATISNVLIFEGIATFTTPSTLVFTDPTAHGTLVSQSETGTATQISTSNIGAISNVAESASSVVTLIVGSGNWTTGMQISLSGLTAATWLNGHTVTLSSVSAGNNFISGQTVFFQNMVNALFLNDAAFTISATGFGQSFGAGFGGNSVSQTQFQVVDSSLSNFNSSDTGTAHASAPIALRNAQQGWSPLDISIIYTNLLNVKRTSVLDGSDRYIVISPYSVLVYAVFPSDNPVEVLIRRLFLPNGALILDAVHTEQDYTLVLDSEGNIWRYAEAAFINTDNPDTMIRLSNFTSLNFADADLANDVHILTTVTFANQRVVVVSGEAGAVLLQMNTATLAVTGVFELTVASNFVFGANKVQFVRWVNMDTITTGRILLGTILNSSGAITNVALTTNALTITCNNTFSVGDMVVLSGITNASFLNGLTVKVIAATLTSFEASLEHANYTSLSDTGLAQSQTSGNTYETLIDLSQQQIVGTFDKSKLRNQFVETGEIMFDPNDTYAGQPSPPLLLVPTAVIISATQFVQIAWQQVRPDLINSYTVQSAVENTLAASVPVTAPFTFQVPATEEFTADRGVFDTVLGLPMTKTDSPTPFPGEYNVTPAGLYTFNASQAGHSLVITIRQAFNNLVVVTPGSVQSTDVLLPPGVTYFFRVQAIGLDGTSGFSNVQQITI